MSVTNKSIKFMADAKSFQAEVLKFAIAFKAYQNGGDVAEMRIAAMSFASATADVITSAFELYESYPGGKALANSLGLASLALSTVSLLQDIEAYINLSNNPNATEAQKNALTMKLVSSSAGLLLDVGGVALSINPAGRSVKLLFNAAPAGVDVAASWLGAAGDVVMARELKRKSTYHTQEQKDFAEALVVRAVTVDREPNRLLAAYGGMDSGGLNPTYFRIQQYETTLFRMDLPFGTTINRSFDLSGGFSYTGINGFSFRITSAGQAFFTPPGGAEQPLPDGFVASVSETGLLSIEPKPGYIEEIDMVASLRNEILANGGSESYASIVHRSKVYGGIGDAFASSLGRYLGGGNQALGIVYSSVLGEIGERLAISIANGSVSAGLEINIDQVTGQAVKAAGMDRGFGADVWTRMQGAAIGSVSSLLAMELGEALGLEGFGAELFNTVGSTVISKAFTNVLVDPGNIFGGFDFGKVGDGFSGGGPSQWRCWHPRAERSRIFLWRQAWCNGG